MPRNLRYVLMAGVLALAATGCAAARQIAALKQVHFAIDRAQQVDLVGIRLDNVRSTSDVSGMDAARIAAAVLRRNVPLAFTVVVRGENPADNAVTARMLRFSWTLLLNDRETVSGSVDTAYTFAPGQPTDMHIPVRLDLYQFFNTNAREALDVALGILGRSSRPTDIVLTAVPVIDTPIGPINYPSRVTIVRRTVGGATR